MGTESTNRISIGGLGEHRIRGEWFRISAIRAEIEELISGRRTLPTSEEMRRSASRSTRRRSSKDRYPRGARGQITLQVPDEWLVRADKLAEKLSTKWIPLTRMHAFRAAISRGLEAFESDPAF